MASQSNFSKKNRGTKDSDTFLDPQNNETNNINNLQVKGFEGSKEKWRELCSYFRHYPDRFLDFISPPDAKIQLYYYQRVYLRIMMRYRKVFLTATRGTSKSYLQNLAFMLKCIFYPKTKLFTCAVGKEQAAKITADNINDILDHYPLLRNEIKIFTENKDYTKLIFNNGSKYDVVQMRDSSRGGRRYSGCVEEISDKKFDGAILNAVVIPLMANDRPSMSGVVDQNEVHKCELYITTAGTQQQFAYEKMSEVYQDMLNGKSAFCLGNSYELPCMYGQLDIDFIEELRESPTYSIMDFMREYQSIWTGSSSDSLVSDDKIQKCRTVGIAEWEHCGDENVEYVLAYDVSRNEGDQNALSCLAVFKITPKNNGTYLKEIVNIFSMEGQHSTLQAKFLKEKVKEYKAKILVIDNNGLGVAVTDSLVLDLNDGNPPYAVVNDDRYDKYKLPNCIPMVFALKSQNKETKESDMVNHFMQVFTRLDINLLKGRNDGIKELEKKYKHKIKESEELVRLEIPYLLTDILCEEVLNLRYKQAGNETRTERISRRIRKDKFSAVLYGLYWIYMQERDNNLANDSDYDFVFSYS